MIIFNSDNLNRTKLSSAECALPSWAVFHLNGNIGNVARKRWRKWNDDVASVDVNMAAVERTLVLEIMLEEENDDYYDFVSVIVLSALSEENRRIRIGGHFERIVPVYSEVDFKSHFRMGRSTMEILCQDIIAT